MKFVEQPTRPPPHPKTTDPDTIDKYYETFNLEQEVACLMLSRGRSVSKLLSLKDEELLGHTGTPRIRKTIVELHAMLKLHEKGIPKKAETLAMLALWEGKIQKDKKKPQGVKGKDKGKNKIAYAPKPKIPPSPKRDNLVKESVCHICKEVGHWKKNCPSYQAELKKRKNASIASTSAVEAIRSFDLVLPSGLIIVLENFHFVPTITRGVVSISPLVNNGYIHTFTNFGKSVSKDNVFYFNVIPRDGIYEIDMHNLYPNVSSMLATKEPNMPWTLLIYGIVDESLEKCKSCIFGKMASKPFPHQVERAKDLLGLIHIDVCGPFRTVSRVGASYFITFTDDFIRYGYVYLMKHKHEGYALESAVRILNMVPTKKVEKMHYEIWHGKAPKLSYLRFFKNGLMVQEVSGSHGLIESSGNDKELELIQEEDIQPSKNTSEISQAPDRSGFYVDVEEYELRYLNEPPNYKAALSDPESDNGLKLSLRKCNP
ncbi:retrotransposon protein, putative, ty1-copia subclass [Tanacetum coccineum]